MINGYDIAWGLVLGAGAPVWLADSDTANAAGYEL